MMTKQNALAPSALLALDLLLVCLSTAPSQAQTFSFPIPGIKVPGLKSPLPAPSAAPATASGPSSPATVTAAASHIPVMFNNKPLFEVYGVDAQAAQDRADLATLRLADALKAIQRRSNANPPQTTILQEKSAAGGAPGTVLRLSGKPLLTVTQIDADNYGVSISQLAASWSDQINKAFAAAIREQAPSYARSAAIESAVIILVGFLINVLIWFLAKRFRGSPGWPLQVLLWTIVIRACLYLFPQTRPFDAWLLFGAARPFTVIFDVGLLAAILARLWGAVLGRLFPPMTGRLSHGEVGRRTFLRRATLASIARVTGVTIIWVVGIVSALGWAGVNLSALLTSAGLIGVGIGLATQDMMKDLVAGINILADDRFGVGDTIQMGEYEGRVERLDLRITQIRDLSGRLITIPNRNIAQVANMTSNWAQVDLRIGVSYYDDLRHAMEIMVATAEKLRTECPDRIPEAPDMLGVDSFNDSNITLRMLVRTPPGDQWHIARELRERIKVAFDGEGIALFNALHIAKQPAANADAADTPEPSKNGAKDGADTRSEEKGANDAGAVHE